MKKLMQDKLIGIIATLVIKSLIVWMASNAWGAWMDYRETVAVEARADYEANLARELVEIKTTSVACGTSATAIAPGAGTRSVMVVNTSATAVYVGGDDVDGSTAGTTGIDVCDGCTAGKTLSMDARGAYCVVASGSVTVEVVYGVN